MQSHTPEFISRYVENTFSLNKDWEQMPFDGGDEQFVLNLRKRMIVGTNQLENTNAPLKDISVVFVETQNTEKCYTRTPVIEVEICFQ